MLSLFPQFAHESMHTNTHTCVHTPLERGMDASLESPRFTVEQRIVAHTVSYIYMGTRWFVHMLSLNILLITRTLLEHKQMHHSLASGQHVQENTNNPQPLTENPPLLM